jgi:hypothetical protein
VKTGFYVGVQEGAVRELRRTIMEILRSGVDGATMQAALRVLGAGVKVEGLTISNCTVIDESNRPARARPGYQREGD